MSHSKQALEVLDKIEASSGGSELVFSSLCYTSKPPREYTFNSALARMGHKSIRHNSGFQGLVLENKTVHFHLDL